MKIRTVKTSFKKTKTEITVNYQPSNRFFIIQDIPTEYIIRDAKIEGNPVFEKPYGCQHSGIVGKTEDELMQKFDIYKAMIDNQAEAKTEKIIIVRYTGTPDDDDQGFYLNFDYEIYTKIIVGETYWYEHTCHGKIVKDHRPCHSDDIEIKWTVEREAFLQDVVMGFDLIHKKLKTFLSNDKALVKAVDDRIKLLPGK